MIIPVSEFGADYLETYDILKRQTGKRKAGRVKTYLDCVAAFDIETSYISAIDETVMYIWMFQFLCSFSSSCNCTLCLFCINHLSLVPPVFIKNIIY